MATQTHETRIAGQPMPPRRVLASEARRQLEKDTLTAMIAGMSADKFLLGDLLDICPADSFVTSFARPIAEALDILRKSGARQDIVTLATQMQERWALDRDRWIRPDLVWLSEAAGSPWGLRSFAETFSRKLANEHRRAELHASLLRVAAEADVYGVDVCEVAERARKVADEALKGETTANGMSYILERIRENISGCRQLILGNMAKRSDTVHKVSGATGIFYLSDQDVALLDSLAAEGVDIVFHQLPNGTKLTWSAFKETL